LNFHCLCKEKKEIPHIKYCATMSEVTKSKYYNNIVLFTKDECSFCDHFKPQFDIFFNEEYWPRREFFPPDLIQVVKNPSEQTKAEYKISGLPTLYFYVNGNLFVPEFFSTTLLRKFPILNFASTIVYYVDRHCNKIPLHHQKEINEFFQQEYPQLNSLITIEDLQHQQLHNHYDLLSLFLSVNRQRIIEDLQTALDKNYSAKEKTLPNYPKATSFKNYYKKAAS
jgi:hypothetical protein